MAIRLHASAPDFELRFRALLAAKRETSEDVKEFRYLRTVIVTAAVYRGFGSKLHPRADLLP